MRDFLQSDVVLNDYGLIRELREAHGSKVFQPRSVLTPKLLEKLHALGDAAADHLRTVLPQALQSGRNVLVLTHVPPFLEACWHEGRLSGGNWSRHFTCQAAGDVLVEFMQRHPDRRMTVLCGHTHNSGPSRILDNLEVITGEARYGRPMVQQTLEVEGTHTSTAAKRWLTTPRLQWGRSCSERKTIFRDAAYRKAYVLQWGRTCSERKTLSSSVSSVSSVVASMGPLLFRAEDQTAAAAGMAVSGASMGPLLFRAEDSAFPKSAARCRSGFNGAALVQSGRPGKW